MKTLWIENKLKYDGSQLTPLRNYLQYGLLGDSVIAWQGPCDISIENMVDGEDLLTKSEIRGDEMLHFIFEIFHQKLSTAVFLQRLFASICKDVIEKKAEIKLHRDGDDLYFGKKKLSISIAAPSANSMLVHFAMNIKNSGTPVPTCALEDWKLDPATLAKELMPLLALEYASILEATVKVKSV